MAAKSEVSGNDRPPLWLQLFCFALMGPAVGINGALLALAVPAMAPLGYQGLIGAGLAGVLLGIVPARWMARKIHEGIREQP